MIVAEPLIECRTPPCTWLIVLRVSNWIAAGSTARGFALHCARVSPSGSCVSGWYCVLPMSVMRVADDGSSTSFALVRSRRADE